MPGFFGNPAGALPGEAQNGNLAGLAGENAVGAGEVTIEIRLLHVQGGIAVRPGMRNAVQGETTQSVAMMAPGVEVPVVSVSRETLGRNGAPGLGVGRARM